jgi:dephospho-CoA kinase
MSRPDIIISGKMGTGKTTAAKYLESNYGYKIYSFADKLRELAYDLFEPYIKEDTKPRELLQDLGDSIREICYRCYGEREVWVKYLQKRINDEQDSEIGVPYVIDDCRYKNELHAFMWDMGWKSLRINVDMDIRKRRYVSRYGKTFSYEQNSFISEVDLDNEKFNFVINNNDGLLDLYKKLDAIVSSNAERSIDTQDIWQKL